MGSFPLAASGEAVRVLLLSALTACVFVDEPALDARLDPDGDGVAHPDDCDSTDATVFPGADEACDGVDQDCDGEIDEDLGATYYADADGDGHGDADAPVVACTLGDGLAEGADDCDDTLAAAYPGAPETDCTDPVDYNCDGATGADDLDQDGAIACEDCDDADATRFPGAAEVCDDVDQDCDEVADDDATDAATWYADGDGDGFGDAATTQPACDAPDGWVADATDCDDADADAFPGAAETCDPGDDDCDGETDEAATDAPTWYADDDGDGYGDPDVATDACDAPAAHVADATDCDDAEDDVHPGAAEADCADPVDYNCDGSVMYADADADGYAACDDCDDTRADVSPVGVEICDEADADEDCDGLADDDDPGVDAATRTAFFGDADGDGHGAGGASQWCDQPARTSATDGDCDDGDAAIHPGATESCATADDDDCDGTDDAEGALGCVTRHLDADGDGWGTAASSCTCEADGAYTSATTTDCDDTAAGVSPGETEVCDDADVDEDCDGAADDADTAPSGLSSWYADGDTDGHGDPTVVTEACEQPAGHVAGDADCDDADAAVSPDAVEVCENGVDDDCDGGPAGCGVAGTWSDGDADVRITGSGGSFSRAMASADFTGDGVPDLVVSAWEEQVGSYSNAGGVYLFDTMADGDTSAAVGHVTGTAMNDYFGYQLATGDVTGDGVAELLVTMISSSTTAVVPTTRLSGTVVRSESGIHQIRFGGPDVAAFDGDGDAVDDVFLYDMNNARLDIVRGPVTASVSSADVTLTGTDMGYGRPVVWLGDIDGDGVDDLGNGYSRYSGSLSNQGVVYVVSGDVAASTTIASAASLTITGDTSGQYVGDTIAGGGDLDGDGADDVVVGASADDTGASNGGSVFVVGGGTTGTVSVASATARISGTVANGYLGRATPLARCDFDGDGHVDLVTNEHQSASGVGTAYVFFGPLTGALTVDDAGAVIAGDTSDQAGGTLHCDDFDLDGTDDLVVSTDYSGSGAVAVFFGAGI